MTLLATGTHAQTENLTYVVTGFGVQWGQNVAQVEKAATIITRRIDPPLDYGPLVAPLVIGDLPILDSRFFVFFQFDRTVGALQQILVQRRRADGEKGAHDRLLAALQDQLGAPADTCHSPDRASVRRMVERWKTDRVTLRLVLLDYRARGLITEGEPLTDDPTVPWYKRESLNYGSLPVRVLLRLSAPGDNSPDC